MLHHPSVFWQEYHSRRCCQPRFRARTRQLYGQATLLALALHPRSSAAEGPADRLDVSKDGGVPVCQAEVINVIVGNEMRILHLDQLEIHLKQLDLAYGCDHGVEVVLVVHHQMPPAKMRTMWITTEPSIHSRTRQAGGRDEARGGLQRDQPRCAMGYGPWHAHPVKALPTSTQLDQCADAKSFSRK